jgi:hypothetical protein
MPDTHQPDQEPVEIEDIGSNPDPRETLGEVMGRRLSRRAAMLGLGAAATAATLTDQLLATAEPALAQVAVPPRDGGPSTLTFPELRHQLSQGDAVAEGYETQLVVRWGDPILGDAPEFNIAAQTPAAQAAQFGYNCDYLDFFPLPAGSRSSDRGLLCVNHEYTNTNLMFSGIGAGREARLRTNAEQARVEVMAHGMSVVEVQREGGRWRYVRDSRLRCASVARPSGTT